MSSSIVLRFYGRFVFATDLAKGQCHVLAVNPFLDLTIPGVHNHTLLMNARRQAVVGLPREPNFVIAFGPDPKKAEHSLWNLAGLDTVVGKTDDFTLDERDIKLPDLKDLTDNRGVLDPASLKPGAHNGLVTAVLHLRTGSAKTGQIDEHSCEFVPLGDVSPVPRRKAASNVADMVEVAFEGEELVIGGFRIKALAGETTFVNISNLCCHAGADKDIEFAAHYRVLTPQTQPADDDRLVPVELRLASEEDDPSAFFEVDCYKAAKIAL